MRRPGGYVVNMQLFALGLLLSSTTPLIAQQRSNGSTEIKLLNRVFTPDERSSIVPPAGAHALLQVRQPLDLKGFDRLRQSGFEPVEFVDGSTYIVRVTRKQRTLPTGLVRWAGRLEPSDKLHPALSVRAKVGDNPFVLISFHRDVTDAQANAILRQESISGKAAGKGYWTANLTSRIALTLAQRDEVRLIEPGPPQFMPLVDEVRAALDIDAIQGLEISTGPAYLGLSGRGTTIGIIDTYIDREHDDFWNHDASGARTATRLKIITPLPAQPGMHGTQVASIAAGNGFRSDKFYSQGLALGPYRYRGMAPEAAIYAAKHSQSLPAVTLGDAVRMGSDVTNHSYILTCNGYDSIQAELDKTVRGDQTTAADTKIPARPAVLAIGNNGFEAQVPDCGGVGYFSIINQAKNGIGVGATDITKAFGSRAEFSSMGPTPDGRVKPDLMAPGKNWVRLPVGTDEYSGIVGTNEYIGLYGTSQAAPVVSGVVSLLTQEWKRYNASSPLPSTIKTVLIGSANDLVDDSDGPFEIYVNDTGARVRYGKGPDWATGFGVINPAEAVRVIREGRVREDVAEATTPNREYVHFVNVMPGAAELKITLAWDDVEASSLGNESATKLVNDLDLVVKNPAGNVILPLVLSVPPKAPSGPVDPITGTQLTNAVQGIDRTNNVEQVVVENPTQGTWSVHIVAHSLPTSQDQPYSLTTSAPFTPIRQIAVPHKLPCGSIDWGRGIMAGQGAIVSKGACLTIPVRKLCLMSFNCAPCKFGKCPSIRVITKDDPTLSAVRLTLNGVEYRQGVKQKGNRLEASLRADVAANAILQLNLKSPVEGRYQLPVSISGN